MATFVATGVSAVTLPTVNGNTTVVLTNTSSFIGTVYLETSLDGGFTWPTPSQPLTSGTMVAGPLTFNLTTPQLTGGSYQTAQHRLRCAAYTSGTLTYTVTEAAIPAQTGLAGILVAPTSTGNTLGSFAGILGTTTNDAAPVGEIGEYQATAMTGLVAGVTFTCPTANPGVLTLASLNGLANLQAVTVSNSGGALPSPLVAATNYYVFNLNPTALTCSLATSLANAQAGTGISITVGTGTQTIVPACSLATTVAADICGLALTAGDWDVDAIVYPGLGASISMTTFQLWIAQVGASAAPTTAATVLAQGLSGNQVATANTSTINNTWQTAGTLRVSLSAAGYLALAALVTFSAGSVSPQALLRARRVR